MIKVFYGEDRVRALDAMKKWFGGAEYEVIDAGELTPADLPNIFRGGSLLADERRILVRDLLANKAVAEEVVKYVDTPHQVVMLEGKLDKRTVAYKELAKLADKRAEKNGAQGNAEVESGAKVEFKEFKLPQPDFRKVFDIFRVAKQDGAQAVKMLAEIQETEEPKQFVGLMASQAMRDFAARPGAKEKRVLKELARLDMNLNEARQQPWLLVQSFLVRLAEI